MTNMNVPPTKEPKCDRCQTPMVRYTIPGTGAREQAWKLACSCKHTDAVEVSSSNLVSRLLAQAPDNAAIQDAAKEIERLREEVKAAYGIHAFESARAERLRAALAFVTRDRDTLLEMTGTTIEQVARRIEKLRGTATKMPAVETSAVTDETLQNIADQYDQGPGGTYEFDPPTLIRMLREVHSRCRGTEETPCEHDWTLQVEKPDFTIYCCEKCGKFVKRRRCPDCGTQDHAACGAMKASCAHPNGRIVHTQQATLYVCDDCGLSTNQ